MTTNQSAKKFQRVLASLPPATRKAVRAEVFHQAAVLKGDIAAAAPHGPTGVLAASVRVEPGRSPLAALVRAGGKTTTRTVGFGFFSAFNAAVRGRAEYDYAIAQEFGTQHIPAQPFFWPTYRAKKRAIRKAIKAEATDAIGALVKLS